MIKHLYGDGAKGTKLLTMCNIWVNKSNIFRWSDIKVEEDDIPIEMPEICKECKLEQEKRDKLDAS